MFTKLIKQVLFLQNWNYSMRSESAQYKSTQERESLMRAEHNSLGRQLSTVIVRSSCFAFQTRSILKMLPDFLLQILNNHGDDLQQLALLSYLKSEDKGRPFLEAVTAAKVSVNFVLIPSMLTKVNCQKHTLHSTYT